MSPFSKDTARFRETDIGYFATAVEGSSAKVAEDLAAQLPKLLWLYQMGLILFWIYDRSAEQRRTAQLLDKSLKIIVTLLRLSGLPLMKPVRKTVLDLLETVYGEEAL